MNVYWRTFEVRGLKLRGTQLRIEKVLPIERPGEGAAKRPKGFHSLNSEP